jgi:hypothetical protein
MKKRNVVALCMVLCAVLAYVTVGQVYAQQEETQLGETQNMAELGPDIETAEQSVEPDPENTEPVNEPEQPDQSEQPDPFETPEVSETPEASEGSGEPETTPPVLPSDALESPDPEEEIPVTDPENTEKPQDPEEINGNLAVAAEIEFALRNLDARVDYIAGLIGVSDYTLIDGDDNFYDALAIYAVRHDQAENYPYGVVIADEKESAEFQSIYWSLNAVNAAKTENGAVIRISRLSVVSVYALSGSERETFDLLNTIENRELVSKLLLD